MGDSWRLELKELEFAAVGQNSVTFELNKPCEGGLWIYLLMLRVAMDSSSKRCDENRKKGSAETNIGKVPSSKGDSHASCDVLEFMPTTV